MNKLVKNIFLKNKKRRILVISAGGMQAGIQCIYIETVSGSWEIISHLSKPYPQRISDLVEKLTSERHVQISVADMGWLEYKLSISFQECAKMAVAQLPKSLRRPHYIVLNKLTLWKGQIDINLQQTQWDFTIGDAQCCATALKTPIFSDFLRYDILSGGYGNLPAFTGNLQIAGRFPGVVMLLNIGVVARMTLIDNSKSNLLIDSDTGPGTCCINRLAKEANCPDNFDRDGSYASKGNVNGEYLDKLASSPWFQIPAPKNATPHLFESLIDDHGGTAHIDLYSKLTTITALTARTIYEFYRREYTGDRQPSVILVSGGGTNNLTLMEFMKMYFDPIPIKNVDEIGIPTELRIPLALGLTIDSHLSSLPIPWKSGNNTRLGRWYFP